MQQKENDLCVWVEKLMYSIIKKKSTVGNNKKL